MFLKLHHILSGLHTELKKKLFFFWGEDGLFCCSWVIGGRFSFFLFQLLYPLNFAQGLAISSDWSLKRSC